METTVLLVDDEEDIRDLLSILLTDIGFDVIQAADGDTAFDLFKKLHPPIVLTDIKMPGMDGIDLLKNVKREDNETEVIMISGHGDMEIAIESLKYQASDFITKPIKETILIHALHKAQEKLSLKKRIKAYAENLENLVKEKSRKVIELERQLAVGQVLQRISSGMKAISGEFSSQDSFPEIPCFISIHNSQMEIIAANELYRERFGEKQSLRSWQIYKDANEDGSDCPVGQILSGKEMGPVKHTAIAIDGSETPVSVYAMPITNADGKTELVIEMAVDVTGVNRLQDELLETQRKFQRLFDEAPCYITVQDKNLCIVEANQRFRDDFGYENDTPCYVAYKRRCEPCTDCPILKTFEDGQPHHAETVVTAKNGEQYNILVWTAPLKDSQENIIYVLEMATNITMIRQLQDHITSLGIMLGSMSHGIKGLLTAMDGGTYLINQALDKKDFDSIRSGWDMVKLRIDRIRKMVTDILYYAKPRELEISSVRLKEFSEDLASIGVEKAKKGSISFIKEIDGSSQAFEADSVALSSALVNFIENAFDACEMDRSKREHFVRFSAKMMNDAVHFIISDNGVGMDEETKNKMFTLFFSSKGSRGTGIGLFVSNHVITQHFGKLIVDSELGKGTTIKVQIPNRKPFDSIELKDCSHAN